MGKKRIQFISVLLMGILVSSGATLFSSRLSAEESSGAPDQTVPEAAVPEATVPEAAVPEGTVPEAAVPDANIPQKELSPEDKKFLADLTAACDKASDSFENEYDMQSAENLRIKARLETKNLIYSLNRNPDQVRAQGWIDFLLLNDLKEALAPQNDDMETVEKSLARFEGDEEGLDSDYFIQVRDALRDYKNARKRERTGDVKEDFAFYCRSIKDSVRELLANPTCAESAETVTEALSCLNEYQPHSKNVHAVSSLIRDRFSTPNIEILVGSKVLFPEKDAVVTKPTTVKEIIRGNPTYGKGTVTGSLHPVLVKNDSTAEIRLTFNADIKTNTTAYSQGVTILSSNNGKVIVTKPVYFNGTLSFGPTASSSNLQSVITGVNTGRGPIGSKVVYDRINQEYPYSKAESQRLMEYRVVSGFESQINQFLADGNYFNRIMELLKKNNYEPKIESRTTESDLAWNALVGSAHQIGPIQKPSIDVASRDMTVKIHQSAFNNPFYVLLAGRRLSEQEVQDRLKELFPNVDFDKFAREAEESIQKNLAQEAPQGDQVGVEETAVVEAELPRCNENADFYLTFYKELPLVVLFKENKIIIQARIDLFEQDKKTFPGLDIEVVYQLDRKDNRYVMTLQQAEAWPPEIARNETIPARFQVIRSQVLKRMNGMLPTEIPIESIPIKTLVRATDQQTDQEAKETAATFVAITKETAAVPAVITKEAAAAPAVITEEAAAAPAVITEEAAAAPAVITEEAAVASTSETTSSPLPKSSDADVSEIRGILDVGEFFTENGWLVFGADYYSSTATK